MLKTKSVCFLLKIEKVTMVLCGWNLQTSESLKGFFSFLTRISYCFEKSIKKGKIQINVHTTIFTLLSGKVRDNRWKPNFFVLFTYFGEPLYLELALCPSGSCCSDTAIIKQLRLKCQEWNLFFQPLFFASTDKGRLNLETGYEVFFFGKK